MEVTTTGIILCMRPANERRRYNVTSSLISWANSQNDSCYSGSNANPVLFQRCQARSAAVEEQLKEANLQTGIVQSGKCGISWNIAASNEPDTSLALPPILPLTADEQAQFIGKECKENISNAAARDAWMAEATVIEADLQIVDFDPEDAMTPRTEFAKTSAEDLRKEIESLESMESEGRESPPADVPKESSTLIGEKILDELMGPQEEQALSKVNCHWHDVQN